MTITLLATSFITLLLLWLSINVVKWRRRTQTGIGVGDSEELHCAVRAHANLIEYAPFGLLLIGVLEFRQVNELFIIGLASIFVLARFLHAIGLTSNPGASKPRIYGTLFTWIVLGVGSVAGILNGFSVI